MLLTGSWLVRGASRACEDGPECLPFGGAHVTDPSDSRHQSIQLIWCWPRVPTLDQAEIRSYIVEVAFRHIRFGIHNGTQHHVPFARADESTLLVESPSFFGGEAFDNSLESVSNPATTANGKVIYVAGVH